MTQPSYDLLNEPWIPVLRADGRPAMLGLRDVLLQAHQLRGLAGETPLTTAALYRLLLVVLYRALGAPTMYSWEQLWEQGHFPAEALEEYLTRWQHRFDLFHPERPFLQWPDDRVKPKSVLFIWCRTWLQEIMLRCLIITMRARKCACVPMRPQGRYWWHWPSAWRG